MPVIMTGVRLALVQVWATATIAALVAGPGLGRVITRGFANHRTYEVVAGAILVAVGALLLEGLAVLAERYADPMRRARRQPGRHDPTRSAGLTRHRSTPAGCRRRAVTVLQRVPPGTHRTRAGLSRGTQKVVPPCGSSAHSRLAAASGLLMRRCRLRRR